MNDLFKIPPDQVYLLNHSVGCLPKLAITENEKFINSWYIMGSHAWDQWLDALTQFTKALGRLFSARFECFCPTTNVSDALFKIITSLPNRDRKKIVYSELDFPTIGYIIKQLPRLGFEPVMIKRDEIKKDLLRAYKKHIDNKTEAVIIPLTTYGDSQLFPVEDLLEICQGSEAYTILDVAQAAGVVPFDLSETPVDFLIGSCIKWLCGGPGAGYLYADPMHLPNLSPLIAGWFSNQEILSFDINRFEYAAHGRRFLGGTPSILPYVIANAGIVTLLEIGIDKIHEHNKALKEILFEQLGHFLTFPAKLPRGGTVTLKLPNPEKIAKALHAQQFAVDYRPHYGIRVSPHIYNTATQIRLFCDAVDTLLR